MPRVLVVTFDFPPQGGTGAIRVTKFVRYLPQCGWQPVVVCSDTLWNRDDSLLHGLPSGLVVRRVPSPAWTRLARPAQPTPAASSAATPPGISLGYRLKRRAAQTARQWLIPDTHVLWVGAAVQACMQTLREYPCDAIFTTSPPHSVHLVGRGLQRRNALPWVADFRDVWTAENPTLQRVGRLHFARQREAERRVLAACDHAILVTEPLRQRAIETFGPRLAEKSSIITNGFDAEDFASSRPALENKAFTITYTGTVLGPQVDNAFPEGLRLALAHSEDFCRLARIRFVGLLDPAYQARLAGLENHVTITGFIEHRAAIDLARASHLLLLMLPNTRLAQMTFTNKFFEYLAARRPLLALVPPGLISDVVTRENIGQVAPPDDAQAIAQALLTMFETVRANPDGYAGSDALLARYDRRNLTFQLAEVLEAVSRPQRPGAP